ncbi:MAG: 4-nitrophenyl phosphatase [Bradymonadia bacterium]|jgi:4-nitrophenyl phosphatase
MDDRLRARLANVRGVLTDMDGTLYVGQRAMPGAVELMAALEGHPRLVLTNNSSKSREAYVERLGALGMPIAVDDVLTSGDASAQWLAEKSDLRRPFVLGTPALEDACRRYGLTPTVFADDPDCVLLGFDTTLTYARLADACLLVARGLPYYGTHADRTCIDPRGLLPDAGGIIAAIAVTTGLHPIILGKPEAGMCEAGLRRLGTIAAETIILGDQLDTDMMLGLQHGLISVLTLTGEISEAELSASVVSPDLVVESPAELLKILRAVNAPVVAPILRTGDT